MGNDGIACGAQVGPELVEVPMAKPGEPIRIETNYSTPQSVSKPYLQLIVK